MPWLSKTNFEKLEVAQREALRVVTGLPKSTPTEALYLEAEVDPIRIEAKRRVLIQYEKVLRSKEPGVWVRRQERRLKSNKGLREQARGEVERLLPQERQGMQWKRRPPWSNLKEAGVKIFPELVRKVDKRVPEEERRRVALETMEERGRGAMAIFTDGSVVGGIEDGGAACVFEGDGGWEARRRPAGRISSSYKAELTAMVAALEVVEEKRPESVVIYTDSQALTRALSSEKATLQSDLESLKDRLVRLTEWTNITIQWVPGHVGVDGNEEADRQANLARGEEQDQVPIDLQVAKKHIRRQVVYKPQLQGRLLEVYGEKVARKEGSRKVEVLMAQMRAGHITGSAYYRGRIGTLEEVTCPRCGQEEEKDHWLVCDAWQTARVHCGIQGLEDLRDEGKVQQFLERVGWI